MAQRPTPLPVLRDAAWVFFDVGYTLFDETPAWHDRFEAMSALLRGRGREVSTEEIWAVFRDACETFAPGQWSGVCERLASSPGEAAALAALQPGWRHDLEVAYPAAGPLLHALKSRYKLGVIANQSAGTVARLAERGLGEHFDLVIGSAEAGVRKPDPAIFRLALDRAGVPPGRTVMVGDRLDNDIAPAKAVGMRTVHVRQGGSGRQRPRGVADTPDAAVESLGDVAALFGLAEDLP